MGGGYRWGASNNGHVSTTGWGVGGATGAKGGKVAREKELDKESDRGSVTVFEVGEDEEEDEELNGQEDVIVDDPWAQSKKGKRNGGELSFFPPQCHSKNGEPTAPPSLSLSHTTTETPDSATINTAGTANSSTGGANSLDLLLSLDVALEVIHADREALKRVETFAEYPGHYGHRVRDTIEEIFILMLSALREGHMSKGFAQ